MADSTTDRHERRKQARRTRDLIPATERIRLSREICERAQRFLATVGARVIMVYLSFRTEVQTDSLIDALRQSHSLVAPRLDMNSRAIQACFLTGGSLVRSDFGMSEPPPSATMIDPVLIDAVLVPGLIFDYEGFRLGYGGGYYDEFLPFCRRALRVGLAFEEQLVDTVQPRSWDKPLHYVVTEQRVINTDRDTNER